MTPPPVALAEEEFQGVLAPLFQPPKPDTPCAIACRCVNGLVHHGPGAEPFEHTNPRCLGTILQNWSKHQVELREFEFLGTKVTCYTSQAVPPDMVLFQDAAGRIHALEGLDT